MRLAYVKFKEAIHANGAVLVTAHDGESLMTIDRGARVITVVHKGADPVEVPLENVIMYRAMVMHDDREALDKAVSDRKEPGWREKEGVLPSQQKGKRR